MNKVVCDICGTSYPENAVQCPICGFARSTDHALTGLEEAESTYTYVKGGRFSKANVRKRNQANQRAEVDLISEPSDSSQKSGKKSNAGLIAVAIILLLAIIAVVAYIALRFFIPNTFLYEGFDGIQSTFSTQSTEKPSEATEPSGEEETADEVSTVACEEILLSQTEIDFDAAGQTARLSVVLEPADTTDILSFESEDGSIATVDADGLITAVGEGTTSITVTCGSASVQCKVSCIPATTVPATEEPTVAIMLNRKEITFDSEGQSWMLYDGPVAVSDILWSSDDNTVAMVTDGKVVAVGNGDTTVYGFYEGQSVSCLIHCSFNDDSFSGESGSISEAGSDVQRSYRLYNPYGNAEDVTIAVDEVFPLTLVDADGNEVSGAEWSVNPEQYCSYEGGMVKGLQSGTAEVSATYDGLTYTCVVRIN